MRWELVLNLEAEYMPYLWHIGSSPSCVATSNACTYPLGKAYARIFISFIVHHLNVTERVDKLWYVYGMQYSALFGLAKKFIWVSYNVWKNPNTLLGQSNTCHSVSMLYRSERSQAGTTLSVWFQLYKTQRQNPPVLLQVKIVVIFEEERRWIISGIGQMGDLRLLTVFGFFDLKVIT